MTEMKRVAFTTLSSSTSSTVNLNAGVSGAAGILGGFSSASLPTNSSRFGADFLAGQQNVDGENVTDRKNNKSMRLSIELFPTDSCKYPEFNYSRLLHLEKKKQKKLKQKTNGFTDPFNENDDDVARIARELEKKYGSAYSSGRGRSKKDDLCDIGLGYDESDSFIDNTEAYDEIIPEELETIEGGFYINSGPLEFQKLHTESMTTKTDEIIKMPNRPRKRIISSSSSDSSSSSEEDAEEDVDSDGEVSSADTVKGGKGSSVISQSAEKRSRSNSIVNPTKKPKSNQESNTKKTKVKNIGVGSSSTSNSPKPSSVGSDSEKERIRQKVVKTTTIKDMLKAKRDNFLKMQEGGNWNRQSGVSEGKINNGELKGAASKSSDEDDSSSSGESDDSSDDSDSNDSEPDEKKQKTGNGESSEKLRSSDTKLPEIDPEVMSDIQQFKEVVKMKNLSGKRFQFDDSLAEVFLKLDEALLCMEKTHRNMVFAHLEYHLILPKYFFLRKAKQLRIKEEKMKSKRAVGKLRKAIIEAMPGVIANFEAEIRKHAEIAGGINADHPPKMPKKKFPWNNNLRNLLYDVYQVRWTSFPVLGTRKETLEDFINVFLREKVVELWPKDWMRFEELQREIEKRKAAAKKAKDKKKEKDNNSGNINSNLNSVNASTTSSALASGSATQNVPANNAYMKQFEEFATGSRSSYANSDTESVASSSTSNGLKRKIGGKGASKTAKSKTQSSIPISNSTFDSCKKPQLPQQLPTFVPVSTSQDFGNNTAPNSAKLPTSVLPPLPTTSSSVNQATVLSSQPKHSKPGETNVQVIDLDNYRSPSDILLTSQQMLRPANSSTNTTVANAKGALMSTAPNRRESSSESDGVEIVSIYPAASKAPVGASQKSKYKKNSASNYTVEQGNINTFQINTSNLTNNNNNHNANNNNSQNIKGKHIEQLSGAPNYDKQVVRSFKDNADLQLQHKINLPTSQNGSKKDHFAQ